MEEALQVDAAYERITDGFCELRLARNTAEFFLPPCKQLGNDGGRRLGSRYLARLGRLAAHAILEAPQGDHPLDRPGGGVGQTRDMELIELAPQV